MKPDLEAILQQVAAGELSPQEALPLLDAAQRAADTAPASDTEPGTGSAEADPAWGTPTTGPRPPDGAPETIELGHEPGSGPHSEPGPPELVRIIAGYRSIDVIGDPTVDQLVVIGAHEVRHQDGALVVETPRLLGSTTWNGWREADGRFSFASLPRSIAWAKALKDEHLTVRVNPTLLIEVDASASAVRINGCEGGARLRLVAASLKVDRLRGPLDLDVHSSSVKGSAAITGRSRIRCESSSVKLRLLPGTDVRVHSDNRLGTVTVTSRHGKQRSFDGRSDDVVLGNGTGDLVIDAVMSSVALVDDLAADSRVGI